jgi:glycosyltransferase involved in cell wall biosynthesis
VARAIDSVLAQTHQNVEVVLVDDGSTDGTRDLIRTRYGSDRRVRYFHQPNRGVSCARNTALREIQGNFVALLDSDDAWKPWKLELQLACLERVPHAGMIWTEMESIGPDGRVIDQFYLRKYYTAYRWFTEEQLFTESYPLPPISVELPPQSRPARLFVGDIFSQMIMGNLVHTPTALLRRDRLEKVGTFNEQLRPSGGDFDFHLRTCHAGPVAFVSVAAIQYQTGAADQLTRPENTIHSSRNFLATIMPFISQERERIRLPDHMIDLVLAEAHGWIGEASLNLGDVVAAREHLAKSIWHRPWQPRLAGLLVASLLPPGARRRYRAVKQSLRRRSSR